MTVAGRYLMQSTLGRGGFGEVWEAVDLTLGRQVAVKFAIGITQYPEIARRFTHEGRTLALLHHGSVVTVHDAGAIDHDGQMVPYLVMEMLDGSVWDASQAGSVVETGAQVADALAYVHEKGIVHRDVKPANIMICPGGRTVLMDFGIARDDSSLTRTLTTTGKVFGTPAYMAPEQLQGRAATPASDVYSLGLVLVEKLTSHRLAVGQLADAHRAAIPAHLLPLLARMTSPQPEQRPSAAECAALLRAPAQPTSTPNAVASDLPWRVIPSAAVLALVTVGLFLPASSFCDVIYAAPLPLAAEGTSCDMGWNVVAMFADQGTFTPLGAFAGLAALLVMTAMPAPGAAARTRLTGYTAAALTVAFFLWHGVTNPLWESGAVGTGMLLIYLAAALAVAAYSYRETRTRPASRSQ